MDLSVGGCQVEYRMTQKKNDNKGIFAVENGEIVSLDGDSYHKKEVVLAYEEWSNKNVKRGLTVLVEG